MAGRAEDWFRQARRDLDHARRSLEQGDWEWSCFAAHQAAEKALKAVYASMGEEGWGHSLMGLLEALPAATRAAEELRRAARDLDRHYVPSRYPNAYPRGAPYEFYTRDDAEKAVAAADQILRFCADYLAGPPCGY
ncbi:MAG: HEPN domain-containing protein [Bryobacterales bacterium]|nr:HEPN domain-containing protein [Bryobacteraceae bacterium]MDW8355353.1 HEPN domain-containing protein [Bryobacterales bacterium]